MPSPTPRIAISACLLGRPVRWDGTDRRDPLLAEALAPEVEWVPVCPEVELGMGVPREPIRLVGAPAAPRLVGERSGTDHGDAMRALADRRAAELAALGVDGLVTKRDSPSCGLAGVRVWPEDGGAPRREGTGAFVRVLAARLPLLPIEEEDRLHDPAVRAAFLARVRARAARRAAEASP